MSQSELESNSTCITVPAQGLFLAPGLRLECCLSPADSVKRRTMERCFICIITRDNGRVKYGYMSETGGFGKRLSRYVLCPSQWLNAGRKSLKSFVKGLGSDLRGNSTHSVLRLVRLWLFTNTADHKSQ